VQLYRRGQKAPLQLFDLSKDIGEENDLATEHPDLVKKLEKLMDGAHRPVISNQ
jgi:uncharacterized sulfatase